ncbi:MAG: hypothetical protein OJF62_000294 [Pseudolabrys sp.]|jgi:hypothetical protein|nr:hypothetical protein [Pseudolabrys sp.]
MRIFTVAAVAIMSAAAVSGPAFAQITAAQQSALRANCRSDFMSKCSGVTPGGKDALVCLQKHVDTLSAGCKAAVEPTLPHAAAPPPPAPSKAEAPPPAAPAPAAGTQPAAPPPAAAAAPQAAPPPPAPAAAAAPPASPKPVATKPVATQPTAAAPAAVPTAAQQSAMKAACRSDFMSHCAGVSPGGKAALACLQKNVAALSPPCKSAVGATMHGPAVASAPPAAAPPPVPGAAAPTTRQIKAIKFTCRRDFARDCRGVPPGGPEAIACLQRHMRQLSPNCRTSMAAVADELPPPGVMPPPPAAIAPPPETNPVDAAVMLRACKRDLMRHCRDVPVGGGQKLACLNANHDHLSFRCREAMKVTAPLR